MTDTKGEEVANALRRTIQSMARRMNMTADEKDEKIASLSAQLAEARAVIERLIEQCAQTAEAWHPMLYASEHGGSHPTDSAYRSAREGIARAIRSLSREKPEHTAALQAEEKP